MPVEKNLICTTSSSPCFSLSTLAPAAAQSFHFSASEESQNFGI
jgi:hypothetical protein